jgi:hypothetical protein
MEATQPNQLSNILSEDYRHFEASHERYPLEAEQVFGRVADLRAALQAFREATLGDRKGVEEEDTVGGPIGAEKPDISQPALLPSAEGSVDQEENSILRSTSVDGSAIEVVG